jgi:hypothetical protein
MPCHAMLAGSSSENAEIVAFPLRSSASAKTQIHTKELKPVGIPSIPLVSYLLPILQPHHHPIFSPLSFSTPQNQAGLLLTNSPKSSLVATPNTNLLAGSVTTANSCLSPPASLPSKKACKSSSGVSMVMSAYLRPLRLKRTMAFSTLSFSVMVPAASWLLIDGVEM